MLHKYFLKKTISYIFVLITMVFLVAQTAFSQDTIRYYKEGKLVEEIYSGEKDALPKSAFLPRLGFGLQMLSPSSYPNRILSSRFWSIGGQYRRLLSQKQNISIGIGLELAWNNLRWQTDDFLSKTQDSIQFFSANADEVRKNKLSIFGLSVPIIFYKTFEKNWRIGVGGYADWRLQSFSRTAYTNANETFDSKNFSDFHLQPIRFGVQVEAKYKFFRVFSKYDFSTLFVPDKAGKTNIWTFGIGL